MKLNASKRRKLKYGGLTAALTALIIAVIIIINVIFSALTQRFMWYADLTPELLYTLSDEALDIIENGDDEFDTSSPIEMVDKFRADSGDDSLMIKIIFCDYPDTLDADSTQKYVHFTALELQDKFPEHITVEYKDIIRNPSSVDAYRVNTLTNIYTSSVIVEFGTEYRVINLRSFFTFDSDEEEEPWAYNGEKAFTSSILSVTRVASPVACITYNHGETISKSLEQTLIDAGYVVKHLDLSSQEIPEDCRLVVVHNPISDFDSSTGNNEIVKLDKFLDGTNSLMVFMNPDASPLSELEEYLSEWGISFDRTDGYANRVMDASQSLSSDGYTFKGEYATAGAGAAITEDMRSAGYPKSMIFKNAMSISYSFPTKTYVPEDSTSTEPKYEYGYNNFTDGVARSIYDLFVTSENAESYSNGRLAESASSSSPLKLMTISKESRTTQESSYSSIDEASYVLACGSVDFTSDDLLQNGSYGNTDLLLTALRTIGREPVPVGLEPKPFADSEIDTVTTAEAAQYTTVLALVPLLAASTVGIVIITRRKNR